MRDNLERFGHKLIDILENGTLRIVLIIIIGVIVVGLFIYIFNFITGGGVAISY